MKLKSFYLAIFHFGLLLGFYYLLFQYSFIRKLPTSHNLLNWDAYWYNMIKEHGYYIIPNATSNVAFFPLFPLFWKLLNCSTVTVSIINLLLFIGSITQLLWDRKVSPAELLFILALPTSIFFLVPYSESLFFIFGTLILVGYNKDNYGIKYIGLFGLSLVRSVSILVIPAIIVCELFNNRDISGKERIKNVFFCSFWSIAGLIASLFIHYLGTGKWFYFVEVQKYWGREWRMPHFPLTTTFPARTLGIDSIAFLVGVLALIIFIRWGWGKIKGKGLLVDRATLFSIVYLFSIMLLDTIFTMYSNNRSNIWSINRHMIATPFAIWFLLWLVRTVVFKTKEIYLVLLVFTLVFFATGLFEYKWMALQYIFFVTAITLFKFFPKFSYFFFCFYFLEVFLQIYIYQEFTSGLWVG